MPATSIRIEAEGAIAVITLDRPRSGNSITERMAAELRDACRRVSEDDGARVVVVTGSGGVFCRGSEPPADGTYGALAAAGDLASIDKPVIAAINGDAIDQGLELALSCDIRIAARTARLGLTQLSRGTVPWDGGTQRLPRTVGRSRAMEMVLTSRLVDADEALDIGLVSLVTEESELHRRALDTASEIAAFGPVAVRYVKEAVLKGMDLSLDQGLRLEADLNVILHSTGDRAEGIRSFLDRRPPCYTGR